MSTLVNRNVIVGKRRTSLRLEPEMWDALIAIAHRERKTVHQLCTMIEAEKNSSSLTAAVRVFVVSYFRRASTEDGHSRAGHGRIQEHSLSLGTQTPSPLYLYGRP